ncbi:MAG: peptide ligase PGM1-related protein [Pseudomonadota bacterium]
MDGEKRLDSGTAAAVEAAEAERFRTLQAGLAEQYSTVFADQHLHRTIVVLPSLTLDTEVLSKITGAIHYEQRSLCLLMLLRYPNARVIYLSSDPVPEAIVDYYLHLLPGIPGDHARSRLTLLACHDTSPRPLVEKVLERPRMIERIRAAMGDPAHTHMTCFNVCAAERRLALALGIPIYGCDPDLLPIGSKSGSRHVFREAGLDLPDGVEDLADAKDLGEALVALKSRNAASARAVVKLNDGFSGDGNAIFRFPAEMDAGTLRARMPDLLPAMDFVAEGMSWDRFEAKFVEMGGIAEIFVEGDVKESPSVQFRIDPAGRLETVSTHDQITGGAAGQVFHGCRFPAHADYRLDIQASGKRAAEVLRRRGVLGRFGIDFISVRDGGRWRHFAVEINLRKGGTTHPYQMLQFLTDGTFDEETGTYLGSGGRPLYYYASDNLQAPHYRGLTPDDLIDIVVDNGLHFHTATQEGVVFHLIGALSEYGKLGLVCVAGSEGGAAELYNQTVGVLDREGRRSTGGSLDEKGPAPANGTGHSYV